MESEIRDSYGKIYIDLRLKGKKGIFSFQILRDSRYILLCISFSILCNVMIQNIKQLFFNEIFSGSMEPAFHRGDLLFLTNHRDDPVRVGDIVVFKVEGRDIPIVHRVLKVHEK